jgi:hypothetical protein
VYTTQNTLKADRGTVDVALSLPAKHRGYFQLRIEAADLLSRKTVEVKEYVKL